MLSQEWGANPGSKLEKCRLIRIVQAMLARKEAKTAMPPSRGKGVLCKCREDTGTETHPRSDAWLRTERVKTNDNNTDNANMAK